MVDFCIARVLERGYVFHVHLRQILLGFRPILVWTGRTTSNNRDSHV